MDNEHKLILLDIVNHNERLNEEYQEELLDKELLSEEEFRRLYGYDGHKPANR